MRYAEVVHRCFRCGYCKFPSDYSSFNCPSYRKFMFDTYAPGGRMWLIRAWLNGEIKPSDHFQEILFSCATCSNCVEQCVFTFSDDLVNIFIAAREELVNRGLVPPAVRDYLKNIHISGNPYKLPAGQRGDWAEGSLISPYEGQEYLFYVGCVGSYDERGKRIARTVGDALVRGGVEVGILGRQEICDGNEVRALGEMGLFELLCEQNTERLRERGVQKIITLDPHALNTFKNDYPGLQNMEIYHYTQVLAPVVAAQGLPLSGFQAQVAFHDPCYLGRHNGEYEAPRRILSAIPGVELIELERSRDNSFCCGGGGGNFFTEILGGGNDSPNRIRLREAIQSGASVIAVACPQCAKMMEDGVKAEEADQEVAVLDVGEILSRAMS